jgi:hypothetical protein
MAIIKNCPIGDIHGSIGGITFYGATGKQKARMRTSPNVHVSDNLFKSQLILSEVSKSWSSLPALYKAQWLTYATTYFHARSGKLFSSSTGYDAFCSINKILSSSHDCVVPLTYQFSLGSVHSIVPLPVGPFTSYPNLKNARLNLDRHPNSPVPIILNKIEFRNDQFVKFRINMANTPVVPPGPVNWSMCYDVGPPYANYSAAYFALYCSDAVPYMNASPINYFQYFIGNTGLMDQMCLGMVNSQWFDCTMDCRRPISGNYIFNGVGETVWLTLQYIDYFGCWISFPPVCVTKVAGFSW